MSTGVWIPLAVLCIIRVSDCLECFSCQNMSDPDECRNTSQCSSGQSCFLQTTHDGSDLRYNMGCQNNQLCSSLAIGPNSIIGRSFQTRQQDTCHECCSAERCNQNLCAHRKPSECTDDEKLDCALLNSLFNVCADVHHAKITCPKFCGLCQLVDGNWAEWGNWSSCSVTCENGKQTRKRTCTNPPPSNGGLNCTGPSIDSISCTRQLCPVHGNWSEWSTWSDCSVTCEVGLRKKTRTCTNPRPDRFGDNCYGDASEYTVCQNDPCINPVHGNWSDWSAWSGCSVTCDVGLRKKTRTCTNPKPNRYGDYCVGDQSETSVCLSEPCSTRNGGWSIWGSWQSCSVSCGVGLKLRHRDCSNPIPTAYGKPCEGDYQHSALCLNTPCNVVAFNAHGFNCLSNYLNVFQTVMFNEGNAYDASNGHFTAPVDGLYFFTAHFCASEQKYVGFFIEKGTADMSNFERFTATFEYHTSHTSCSSASTPVKVKRNEHVWVRMTYPYNASYVTEFAYAYNTFTGTLIQEL